MATSETLRGLYATTHRLAEMDPQAEAIARTVQVMEEQIAQLTSEVEKPAGESHSFDKSSRKSDIDYIHEQIKRMKSAAMVPAANYRRIVSILGDLENAAVLASRPQNAAVRPKFAAVIQKLAGVFSEVDTVQDLDKPLAEIENSIKKMYEKGTGSLGQSSNGMSYFDRQSKGHRAKPDSE